MFLSLLSFESEPKNVDFIRLRFPGIAKHLCNHIRVKAHAELT